MKWVPARINIVSEIRYVHFNKRNIYMYITLNNMFGVALNVNYYGLM